MLNMIKRQFSGEDISLKPQTKKSKTNPTPSTVPEDDKISDMDTGKNEPAPSETSTSSSSSQDTSDEQSITTSDDEQEEPKDELWNDKEPEWGKLIVSMLKSIRLDLQNVKSQSKRSEKKV